MLLYVRCLYVGAQLLSLGVYYYATLKIKQKNDLKVLKYTEPAKPMVTLAISPDRVESSRN